MEQTTIVKMKKEQTDIFSSLHMCENMNMRTAATATNDYDDDDDDDDEEEEEDKEEEGRRYCLSEEDVARCVSAATSICGRSGANAGTNGEREDSRQVRNAAERVLLGWERKAMPGYIAGLLAILQRCEIIIIYEVIVHVYVSV